MPGYRFFSELSNISLLRDSIIEAKKYRLPIDCMCPASTLLHGYLKHSIFISNMMPVAAGRCQTRQKKSVVVANLISVAPAASVSRVLCFSIFD